jgi:hypothetical protein
VIVAPLLRTASNELESADVFQGGIAGGVTAMDWIRDRGLTLALVAMFLLFLVGQGLTGLAEYNDEQVRHGRAAVAMADYLATGHPWEALFENWESEFLQMAVFVLLTTFLIQKGSPESRRPGVKELFDSDPRDFADKPDAPWPIKRGGWILRLYEHSLGLAFVLNLMSLRDEEPTRSLPSSSCRGALLGWSRSVTGALRRNFLLCSWLMPLCAMVTFLRGRQAKKRRLTASVLDSLLRNSY